MAARYSLDDNDPPELSKEQIARQDAVDNACHNFIVEQVCEIYPSARPKDIRWEMDDIAIIRDALEQVIVKRMEICDDMTFYPYLKHT